MNKDYLIRTTSASVEWMYIGEQTMDDVSMEYIYKELRILPLKLA